VSPETEKETTMHDKLKEMGLVCQHKEHAETLAEQYRLEAETNMYTNPKKAEACNREHRFWCEESWIFSRHLEYLHAQIQKSSKSVFPTDLYA